MNKTLMLALAAIVAVVGAIAPAYASKPVEQRMNVAEKRVLNFTAAAQVSGTNPGPVQYLPTPVKGYIAGIRCANNGTTATQGASATQFGIYVSNTFTGVSLSIVSGTAVGGVVNYDVPTQVLAQPSNTLAIGKLQSAKISPTTSAGQTAGGPLQCELDVVPNYY